MAARVLLIDSSREVHDLLAAYLRREGIEMHCAFDGLSGLHKAVELQPELIILDVALPQIDGYEVCELLGVQEQTCRTPIIFLTASSEIEQRVRGLTSGAFDYVAKPFNPRELVARVLVALRYGYLLRLENRQAMVDGLTGLWNRRYFEQRLQAELSAATRHERPLSCIMADIDHFKQINDSHGHTFGDQVIRMVAETFQHGCRIEDVVCRYGGEEFVILCPDVPADGTMVLADRLRAAVTVGKLTDPSVRVTCTFGVADLVSADASLVQAADAALYSGKRAGRNRVERAPSRPSAAA